MTVDETTPLPGADETVPIEVVPQLNTPTIITDFERLRELKRMNDELFRKPNVKRHDPGGEFEQLKLRLGAAALAAGVKSVSYNDLRVTNAEGGETKPKLTGAALIEAYEGVSGVPMSYEKLRAIVLAAEDCDASVAMEHGISAVAIEFALEHAPSKSRSASVRVEWIGQRRVGRGGPGSVQ